MAGELTKTLDHWFSIQERHGAMIASRRNPGVSDADLDAAEVRVGVALPAEVREWFKWADGVGGPYGFPNFLPGSGLSTLNLETGCEVFGTWEADGIIGEGAFEEMVKYAPDWGRHRQVRSTFPMFNGDNQLGVECEGPCAGAVFYWGDDCGWTARSLTELIDRAISFVDRGWCEMSQGGLVFREDLMAAARADFSGGRDFGWSAWLQDFDEFSPVEWRESLFWRWE